MTNPPDAYRYRVRPVSGCQGRTIVTVARAPRKAAPSRQKYVLEDQVGFLIRRAHQRASGIFSEYFKDLRLSPVQFAALTKIADEEPVSQNQLGRLIYMDPATTMTMINRLCERGLVVRQPDPDDRRRVLLSVQRDGREMLAQAQLHLGPAVTADTLAPLAPEERQLFLRLLTKLL